MKNSLIVFVCLVFLLGSFSPSLAQYDRLEFIRDQYLRLGFHAKLWEFEDDSRFFEAAVPIVYSTALGKRLSVDVVTAPFGTVLDPAAGEALDLTSISDTYVRGSYIVGDNNALVTLGIGIPSGKTELNNEELALAGIAANRPLANPVTNFGAGFNLSVGVALAQEVEEWVLGLGVGYARRGEYDINDQGAKIDPGDEFNITVGVDREFGSAKFLADIIYTNYSKDESEVLDPYEAGDKILYNARLFFPLGFLNPVTLSAAYRMRLDNETTTQLLVENGNEFELLAQGVAPVGANLGVKLIYRARLYSETDQGLDGASIHGFGGGMTIKLSRHFSFDPTFIYSTGSVSTGPDTELKVTGLELFGGFAFRF